MAAILNKRITIETCNDAENCKNQAYNKYRALADISRSALCCHSNETRAPIANPSNTAQLGGNP